VDSNSTRADRCGQQAIWVSHLLDHRPTVPELSRVRSIVVSSIDDDDDDAADDDCTGTVNCLLERNGIVQM